MISGSRKVQNTLIWSQFASGNNAGDRKNLKRTFAISTAQEAAQLEQGAGPNAEGDNGNAEMAEILNDVEELFGEPVFLTH